VDSSGNGSFTNIYTKSEVYTKTEILALLASYALKGTYTDSNGDSVTI
jgi:hypothetical protein